MDIPLVLEVLKPGLDWGPNANSSSTYAALASTWPAASGVIPTEAQMLSAWAQILIDRPELTDPVIADQKTAKSLYQAGRILRAIVQLVVDEINVHRAIVVGAAQLAWDPANVANGAGVTSPAISVPGAAIGDAVDVAAPYNLAGIVATAYVSAANTVVIRLHNGTGGAVNLANGNWRVGVRRYGVMPPRTMSQARTAIEAAVDAGI